jgi:kynureninase
LPYANDGYRFFGATFDASGLYRLNAVQRWLNTHAVTVQSIRQHVLQLKRQFVSGLNAAQGATIASVLPQALPVDANTDTWIDSTGNYVSIALASVALAEQVERAVTEQNIIIDRRANRVRFGFGVYHEASDVAALLARLDHVLP